MGVQTHPIPTPPPLVLAHAGTHLPYSTHMSFRTQRSAVEESRCHPALPHPLSSRMREPIPPSPFPLRGKVRMGVQTHPSPTRCPRECGDPSLPLRSGGRPPPPVVPADAGTHPFPSRCSRGCGNPSLPHPLSSRMRGPIFAPTSHQPAPAGATIPVALPLPSHMSFRAQRSGAEESRCHPTLTRSPPLVGAVREPPAPQPLIPPTPSALDG